MEMAIGLLGIVLIFHGFIIREDELKIKALERRVAELEALVKRNPV